MFHSIGWTRNAPLVTGVTPRFLQAGSRFSTRTGISAPSGICCTSACRAPTSVMLGFAGRDRLVDVDAIAAEADAVGDT